jgi:hypothetical protein
MHIVYGFILNELVHVIQKLTYNDSLESWLMYHRHTKEL